MFPPERFMGSLWRVRLLLFSRKSIDLEYHTQHWWRRLVWLALHFWVLGRGQERFSSTCPIFAPRLEPLPGVSLVQLSKLNTKTYPKVCITYTHIRLMGALKAKGIDRKDHLPWAAPLQPWAAWVGN